MRARDEARAASVVWESLRVEPACVLLPWVTPISWTAAIRLLGAEIVRAVAGGVMHLVLAAVLRLQRLLMPRLMWW